MSKPDVGVVVRNAGYEYVVLHNTHLALLPYSVYLRHDGTHGHTWKSVSDHANLTDAQARVASLSKETFNDGSPRR